MFIVKHPPQNNLEPLALSKQKIKEGGFRGSSRRENCKLIAPTPKERKKTILEYRFFTNGFSHFSPLHKEIAPCHSVGGYFFIYWRRGRESNPRYAFTYARVPGVCLKPLGHPSLLAAGISPSLPQIKLC